MRLPSRFHSDAQRPDSTMTPMIDVVFLLLVFFVWTASFQIVERLLPSQLQPPARGTGELTEVEQELIDLDRVVVRLAVQDGRIGYFVNDAPAGSLDEVRQKLLAVSLIDSSVPLIIDPAGQVPLGDVIDVYDVSRGVGFHKIQCVASDDV